MGAHRVTARHKVVQLRHGATKRPVSPCGDSSSPLSAMMEPVTDGPELTCLSAFSGLGGMDLGLEAAGFRHVGLIEWDECARRSLKANRSGVWPLLEPGDIEAVASELRPQDLDLRVGELDLLVGAPPCQPYSKAAQWTRGSRQGLGDRRGQYLDDMLLLARSFLPKVVLLENVRGFVQGRTSALGHLRSRLEEIGVAHGVQYVLDHRVIDAAAIGAPQHRSRAIVVASRVDSTLPWPDAAEPTTAWDAIGVLEQDADEIPTMRGKWAGLLPSVPEGENYLWHTDRGGGEPIFGYRTRYWSFLLKLARDRPSWTLPAQPGPAIGPFHWDSRPLSIPEMLRLQTFPAEWQVDGGSRPERVKQVGNATPPLLGEVLGRCVREHLTGSRLRSPLATAIERRADAPPPVVPEPVPAQYRSLIGRHQPHPGTGLGPGRRGQPAAIRP